MAVNEINDVSYREGGQQNAGGTGGTLRETTVVYQILHDANESFLSIRSALGIQPFFTPLAGEPDQVAQSIRIKREPKTREVSYVEVQYSNQVEFQQPEEEDPLDRSVKINISSTTRKERFYKDRDGNAFKNPAGDYFEDTPNFDTVGLRIQFHKNFATAPGFLLTHPNTLNSSAVTVTGRTWSVEFPAETLFFKNFSLQEDLFQNNTAFNSVTWELEYRRGGWTYEPMNRGFNEVNPNNNPPVIPIKIPFEDPDTGLQLDFDDPTRRRPSAPWPLDVSGFAIVDPSTSPATFTTFNPYETEDFTTLPGVS